MVVIIGKLFALASRRIITFGLMLLLALVLAGCDDQEATSASAPDRSTIRGLTEYVLWTFRIDSIEEFEKVNPPMEFLEKLVGKDDPDWPMVKAMTIKRRRRSLHNWKVIKKMVADLGIDWRKTNIADVGFSEISTETAGDVRFQRSDAVEIIFETNGKRWQFELDGIMRKDDGLWYLCDGLEWTE